MENTVEEKGLQLDDLKVSSLPELQGWKEKQEQLVIDNPFVEIVDNKSYEIACKRRTNLLKGRTSLEGQEKTIASKLAAFRKEIGAKTKELIDITEPHEDKQQAEVKRYEAINIAEKEKEKEARLESERVEKIKSKIESFESDSYKIIQETNIENVELHKSMLDAFVNDEFDYEEYEIMFEQARLRVQSYWDNKCNEVHEKEQQRLENEKLKQEIFQVRVNRLKEAEFSVYHESLKDEKEVIDAVNEKVLNASASEFELMLLEVKKNNEEAKQILRDAELKKEKEEIFEIRKNRLAEIGFALKQNDGFYWTLDGIEKYAIRMVRVFESDAIDFETIITDAKLYIKKAEEDAERLKKENKARVKRLATDKEIIAKSFEIYFADLYLETENQEIKDFIESANAQVKELKSKLLTKLNEL